MVGITDLFNLVVTVDRLMKLEAKHGSAIEALTSRLLDLDKRVTRLDAREEIIISEAKGAASAAASQVTMMAVADMARRIGGLEARAHGALAAPNGPDGKPPKLNPQSDSQP
jgi:hypothetical protein